MYITRKNIRGMTLIQFALLVIVIFGFTALTVDYGSMVVTKRKLQNSADAAALAVAQDLWKPVGSESQLVAKGFEYLEANGISHAYTVDPNNSSLDGRSVAVALQKPRNVVVKLVRNVPAPFANAVGEMLMTYENVHNVQGLSEIRAYPGPLPGWIAPLAVQHSWIKVGEQGAHLWDKNTELLVDMQVKAGNDEYISDPGTPLNGNPDPIQGQLVAMDLYNTFTAKRKDLEDGKADAVAQAAAAMGEYETAMLDGVNVEAGKSMAVDGKWVNTAPFVDRGVWVDSTLRGLARIVASSDYTTEEIAALPNRYTGVSYEDARFVALMMIQRSTGRNDFDAEFVGYIGFFISGYEKVGDILKIYGWFHRVSMNAPDRPDDDTPGIPDADEAYTPGLYTYKFVR